MTARCVFFTDVLGFGALSLVPGAGGAQDALSTLANLLSRSDTLGRILDWSGWEERYALSDSIFLVASDSVTAAAAAAEFFFNLAYVSHSGESPVLMRGGVASGEVLTVSPVFPSSATANLVGAAVVQAVRLEGSPTKGPRLFLSSEVAKTIEESSHPVKWMLTSQAGGPELLWLLPPNPAEASGPLIGELCARILAVIQARAASDVAYHYLGYLELVIRSLSRLTEVREDQAAIAIKRCGLKAHINSLEELLMSPQELLARKLRQLVDLS